MKEQVRQNHLQRKISQVNWNQVFYFSLIASQGSIKKAAEILNLSASTLSEHVSQLESTLETTLFHRKGPKLTLTEVGESLFWHAKQMFESGQQILESASTQNHGSSQVRIGVVPGPHLPLAHQFISRFTKEFKAINLKIGQWDFEELESELAKGSLDMGFADQASRRKDLSSHLLSSAQIRFYVSQKWSQHRLRDVLKEIPLLICQSEASTDAFLQKALRDANIEPCGVIKAEYPGILLDLCREGLVVGTFGESTTEAFKTGTFHLLHSPKETPKIISDTYLLWSANGSNTSAIRQVKQLIDQ